MTAEQQRGGEANGGQPHKFLDDLGVRAGGITSILVLFAIALYAVLRVAYSIFYSRYGLRPDDLGFSYVDLLAQSAVGTALLLLLMALCAGFLFLILVALTAVYVTIVSVAVLASSFGDEQSDDQLDDARRKLESRLRRSRAMWWLAERGEHIGEWVARREAREPKKWWVAHLHWLVPAGLVLVVLTIFVLYFVALWFLPDIWFDVVLWGTALSGLAVMLFVGFRVVRQGMRGGHARRWRLGIAGAVLGVLLTATALLIGLAGYDRTRVWHGHAASTDVLGFSITGWGAEDAAFTWAGQTGPSDLTRLTRRCLLYFGQSGGTAFFYRPRTHEVLRIPTDEIVIHTGGITCDEGPPSSS